MNTILGALRGLIGLLQSMVLLGGCAGLLMPGTPILGAAVQWFLILCVIQLGIVLLMAVTSKEA